MGFWSIRVDDIDENMCVVRLPFSWRTQNPFKSVYFSALAGAAELSTGLLCHYLMSDMGRFSMWVVEFRARFVKKATSPIFFSCHQGLELKEILSKLTEKGNHCTFLMVSEGHDKDGLLVAFMEITWSFKKK